MQFTLLRRFHLRYGVVYLCAFYCYSNESPFYFFIYVHIDVNNNLYQAKLHSYYRAFYVIYLHNNTLFFQLFVVSFHAHEQDVNDVCYTLRIVIVQYTIYSFYWFYLTHIKTIFQHSKLTKKYLGLFSYFSRQIVKENLLIRY